MKKSRSRSSVYKKIWEEHNKSCLLPGMHIHHIDGNPNNNDPLNLKACSPEEHWKIHYDQGDQVALSGKFIQSANTWRNLTKEEQFNRIQLMISGTKSMWADPVRRQELIKNRVGKHRTKQSKNNISLGRGGKPFKVFNKNKDYVGTWQNLRQCARDLGFTGKAQIWQCLKKKRLSYKGFRFEYVG